MEGLAVGEILLVGVARPFALEYAVGVFAGEFDGLVRAEAVDDDDLGGDAGDALEGGFNFVLFIKGDDDR